MAMRVEHWSTSGLPYLPQLKMDCEITGEGEESTKPLFPHTLVSGGDEVERKRKKEIAFR